MAGSKIRTSALLLVWLDCACARPPPFPTVPAWNQSGALIVVEDDERALRTEANGLVEKLEKQDELLDDEELARYLDGVLAALLPVDISAEIPRSRVRVLRTAERLGRALPDGTVLVSTGILSALADEAQLAALFGHEVAHLLARHSLIGRRFERLSASTVLRMKLSRELEDDADRVGLELMQNAGYAPRGMVEMLGVFAEEDPAVPSPYPQFESHAFIRQRVRALRARIPVAAQERGRREVTRYEAAITDLLLVAAEIELEAGHLDRASAAIDRHLRLRPDSGRGYYLKAEHERRVARDGRHSPAARRAYERAVELAPDDPDALRALGFLYRESGEPERARDLFDHYLRVAPEAVDRKLIERYRGDGASNSAAP